MTVIDRPSFAPPAQRAAAPGDAPPAHAAPSRHRWTADEYLKLGDRDVFPHRTELINGEIYDVASQNNPHVAAVSKTTRVLVATFDETYWLTIQSTVRLPTGDVPDPDLAVRPGMASADNAVQPIPLLVIEVSDTTLLFDQVVKSSLYAANGVADYWVLNLNAGQVEVYRNPVRDPSRSHGWRYADMTVVQPPGAVSPVSKPDVRIDVGRMLP
jgi:Uma2 family endonuclease